MRRRGPARVPRRLLQGRPRLMAASSAPRPIPPWLLFGFALASNAPLAVMSLFPAAAFQAMPAAGLTALLAIVTFAFPLLVWYRYSEEIVSAGGLFAFVEAAVGRPLALVQAGIWTVSYFLYLPYTVTEVVYDQLPVVFPGITPARPALELVLPLAIIGIALLPV